jgi:hypothetical protein
MSVMTLNGAMDKAAKEIPRRERQRAQRVGRERFMGSSTGATTARCDELNGCGRKRLR